ncbi:MAG: phage tail protein [Clostridium sp.]
MAKIKNPRKKFLWQVTFVKHPINSYLFQSIDLPEKTVEIVEHGDINRTVKTGGRITTGNMTANKLETTSGSDTWLWDWMSSVQDATLGGGLTPSEYWETVKVDELAEDGTSVINSWILEEVWPTRLNGQNLDRMSSDNTIEQIEFAVGTIDKF